MNCLEFKRIALSEPNSGDHGFIKHTKDCVDCLKYVSGVRKMDNDLSSSLNVEMPSDLLARLQFNQEMSEEFDDQQSDVAASNVVNLQPMRRYAVAACLAVSLFVAGFMASTQFTNNAIGDDYELLLSGVVEHLDHAVTPIWDADRANETANSLLASYDGEMQVEFIEKLQFARICPLGKYRGLHASLETTEGQATFVYIKGEPVGEPVDVGYEGYVTRVTPVKGGNLIIMSRTNKSMQEADAEVKEAIYWDI